jgi:hypothetical protein
MTTSNNIPLPPRVKAELTKLAAQAITLDEMAKKASKELDAVKKKIRALVSEHAGVIPMEESSRYWRVPQFGMQVRLTYPSQSPVMDYDALKSKVGNQVFMRITHPTGYELAPEEVNKAITEELIKESDLAECIHDPLPRDPSVYIEKLTVKG